MKGKERNTQSERTKKKLMAPPNQEGEIKGKKESRREEGEVGEATPCSHPERSAVSSGGSKNLSYCTIQGFAQDKVRQARQAL